MNEFFQFWVKSSVSKWISSMNLTSSQWMHWPRNQFSALNSLNSSSSHETCRWSVSILRRIFAFWVNFICDSSILQWIYWSLNEFMDFKINSSTLEALAVSRWNKIVSVALEFSQNVWLKCNESDLVHDESHPAAFPIRTKRMFI